MAKALLRRIKSKILGRILPLGFEELSYIESDGTQYIDTDYTSGANAEITIKFKLVEPGNGQYLCSSHHCDLYTNNGFKGDWGTIEFNQGEDVLDSSIKEITYKYNDTDSGARLFLFCDNDDSTQTPLIHPCKMRLYSFSFKKNGVLMRDYIPCKREIDATAGLYDKVTGEFHSSPNGNKFIGK